MAQKLSILSALSSTFFLSGCFGEGFVGAQLRRPSDGQRTFCSETYVGTVLGDTKTEAVRELDKCIEQHRIQGYVVTSERR